MSWIYLIFLSGLLVCLGAGTIFLLLANRRTKLARDQRTRYFQSVAEIACQSAFSGGLLLIAGVDFTVLGSLSRPPADLTLPLILLLTLILLFGIQLGRLLIRYQLGRLGTLLNTVTGEITTGSSNGHLPAHNSAREAS